MSKFIMHPDQEIPESELTASEDARLRHLIEENNCCGACEFWGEWGRDRIDPPYWKEVIGAEMAETHNIPQLFTLQYLRFCQRYPPTVVLLDASEDEEFKEVRPMVEYNDWCGEFKKRVDHISPDVELG